LCQKFRGLSLRTGTDFLKIIFGGFLALASSCGKSAASLSSVENVSREIPTAFCSPVPQSRDGEDQLPWVTMQGEKYRKAVSSGCWSAVCLKPQRVPEKRAASWDNSRSKIGEAERTQSRCVGIVKCFSP